MRLQLPQIPRIISATIIPAVGTGLLWAALIALILVNVSDKKNIPLAYSNSTFEVFIHPFSASAHLTLAQNLWSIGAHTLAKQELARARELAPETSLNVLGVSTEERAQRIKYWQDLAANHPDYRDAYIQLAALVYAQGNLPAAKAYLNTAQSLDPNGTLIQSLLNFLRKL